MLTIEEQFELGRLRVLATELVEAALDKFARRLRDLLQAMFEEAFELSPGWAQVSPFHKLPPELCSAIFYALLASSSPASWEFRNDRARLLLVCKSWNHIVLHDPLIWTTVTISHSTKLSTLERVIRVTSAQLLAVYILDLRVSEDLDSAIDRSPLLTLFDHLTPTSDRWTDLVLVTPSVHVRAHVLDKTRDLPCSRLRSMTLQAPLTCFYPLPSDFTGELTLTALRRLILHRVVFPVWVPVPMPNLEVLSISDAIPSNSPTRNQLYALLANSPRLHTLELLRVGIRLPWEAPAAYAPLIEISAPSVTTLALAFDCRTISSIALLSFFDALRYITLPNLRHYHLDLRTDEDARSYLSNFLVFPSPSVSLSGMFCETETVLTLFLHLGTVLTLDLVGCEGKAVVECLGMRYSVAGTNPSLVLPSLVRLRVRPRFLRSLYMGLLDRSSRRSVVDCIEFVTSDGKAVCANTDMAMQLDDIRSIAHTVRWRSELIYVIGPNQCMPYARLH
ncbi:hypothetical protein R3P38DRAFT_3180554 [Favolaschia claudopus]|uniref:F-box domain-containing protein n=1 Tax=Favolaschia claudopus TaxID=2862362 RepID=A0AAW0CLL2_9AGAR